MRYKELPEKYKQEAELLVLNFLNSCAEEIALEQGGAPYEYTRHSAEYRDLIEVEEFELVVDEITLKEMLVLA